MPQFTYTARAINGDLKSATLEAPSRDDVIKQLRQQRLNVVKIDSGKTLQAYAYARDSSGKILTGLHVDWSVVDQQSSSTGASTHQLDPATAARFLRRAL